MVETSRGLDGGHRCRLTDIGGALMVIDGHPVIYPPNRSDKTPPKRGDPRVLEAAIRGSGPGTPSGPPFWGVRGPRGGPKNVQNFVPTGRVIKSPKKCALFSAPLPGAGKNRTQGVPPWTPILISYLY